MGILNVKDIYGYVDKKNMLNMPVTSLMRNPFFVPETKKIDSLLKQFQKRKEHMAIVVDEHSVVSGLATIENVLEEIVGEIVDETDRIAPNISQLNNKSWLILGKTDVEDVNEKLKTKFKVEEFETFGGFILDKIGKIPKEDDEIDLNNKYKAIIEDISGNRINSVKLIKK